MAWKDYVEQTKANPPRQLLVQAVPLVIEKSRALDIGAGALNESRYLLSQGFEQVLALDFEPHAQAVADTLPSEHFSYVIRDVAKYAFPSQEFDLVNAQYALPFVKPQEFNRVLQNIYDSLKPKGIFTGQFFGDRDAWNVEHSGMTFHTKAEAMEVLSNCEVLYFTEEEAEKPTAAGASKHWHVFHFIVRK
jgi:tellurite methyltransferase